MDAVASGGGSDRVQSNDSVAATDLGAVSGQLMCRRNALPDILDEAVTKMPSGSAVSTLTRLQSIHGICR